MDSTKSTEEPLKPSPSVNMESLQEPTPTFDRVSINLLHHNASGLPGLAPAAATTTAIPNPSGGMVGWQKKVLPLAILALVVGATSVGGYLIFAKAKPVKPIVHMVPKTDPPPLPSPAPAATVTPPAPVVAPPVSAPQTISAPAVTPTADHPQNVTVQSKSGLWLRSTPDSSSRSNIISWMPNGATVSVDKIGDFWWHGSYNGTAGYFASSYTQ